MAEVSHYWKQLRELKFPVPWGFISAKCWGDPCSSPVLLLHGVLDNAATFDRLIPHLPTTYYYISLDLPGHGHSSHLPKGLFLDFMEYVLTINRIVLQLKWERFIIIGHSLGGLLGQYYSVVFPEQVVKLVALDAYGPTSVPITDYLQTVRKEYEDILKIEDKMINSSAPVYNYEEGLLKMMTSRRTPLTREAALPIYERNIRKNKNGVRFRMDQRLKLMVNLPLSHKQHYFNYSQIICPFLLVMTREMYDFFLIEFTEKKEKSLVGAFRNNPNFKLCVVDGDHDVHNINPEKIGPIISDFLKPTIKSVL